MMNLKTILAIKSLTFEEYLEEVVHRTLKKLERVNGDLVHGVMGLVTETGELMDQCKRVMIYKTPLDINNLKEELGDLCFYFGLLADTLGIDFSKECDCENSLEHHKLEISDPEELFNYVFGVVNEMCSYSDSLRQNVYLLWREKTQTFCKNAIRYDLESMLVLMKNLAACLGFSIKEVFASNARKLRVRYKKGFSKEAALNRDIEGELEAVESKGLDSKAREVHNIQGLFRLRGEVFMDHLTNNFMIVEGQSKRVHRIAIHPTQLTLLSEETVDLIDLKFEDSSDIVGGLVGTLFNAEVVVAQNTPKMDCVLWIEKA